MTQSPTEPDHLLASLINDAQQPTTPPPATPPDADEDVDGLIDALEALAAEGRRMPFGKLIVDEPRLMQIVDRLRTAIPAEVRAAHRVLDDQDRILAEARTEASRMIEERGVIEQIEQERRRIIDEAEREAERTRSEADRYARNVLLELDERVSKLQNSIRNGLEALQPTSRSES